MASTKKKKSSNAKAWEIGGAAAAATIAAAAGAYMLSDKKTKAKAKKWVKAAGKEVVKNAKAAKKMGEKMTAADMIAAGKELKGEWKKMNGTAKMLVKKYAPKKAVAKKKKPAKKARA